MIGDVGPLELLIVLAVVVLLFGVGKVGKLGKELGTSVKEFRRAMVDDEGAAEATANVQQFVAATTATPALVTPQVQTPSEPLTAASTSPNIF